MITSLNKIVSRPDLGKRALSLLLLAPLAGLLANAIAGSNNYLLLITTACIIFFTILTNFKFSLLLIALTSYFLSYSIWFFDLPGPLINLGYALIIMLLFRELFFAPSLLPVRTPINYLLVSIIALGCLSIAGSDAGIYASVKGLLKHVSFPVLFVLILMAEPDEKLMRRLVTGIIGIAFIQVIASIVQFTWYSTVAPKPFGMRADLSGGLLGFSCGGYTSVFMAMTYSLLLGIIIVRGFRWAIGLGAALLLVPIFLASARAGIAFFAVGTFYMLLAAPVYQRGLMIKRLSIAGTICFVLIFGIQAGLGGGGFQAILHPEYVYNYSIKQSDAGMGRLQAFEVIQQELRSPHEVLIGRGPGMLTPVSLADNPNSLLAKNPHLFDNVTGYAYTVLEIGYAGLVLFLLLYLQVYRFSRRFLSQISDPFWGSIALGLGGMAVIYAISTFYIDSWIYYPLPFTFWATAAAVYRVGILRGIFAP